MFHWLLFLFIRYLRIGVVRIRRAKPTPCNAPPKFVAKRLRTFGYWSGFT